MSVPPRTSLRRGVWLLIVIGAFALPVLSFSSPSAEQWLEALPLADVSPVDAAPSSGAEPPTPDEGAGIAGAVIDADEPRYWLLRVTCRERTSGGAERERQFLTARTAAQGQPIAALISETSEAFRPHLAASESIVVSVADGPLHDPPTIAESDRVPAGWE